MAFLLPFKKKTRPSLFFLLAFRHLKKIKLCTLRSHGKGAIRIQIRGK